MNKNYITCNGQIAYWMVQENLRDSGYPPFVFIKESEFTYVAKKFAVHCLLYDGTRLVGVRVGKSLILPLETEPIELILEGCDG